jgi:tetratricopeptide (TPR) repeat protein
MDEDIEKLNQLAEFFRKVNKKVLLLGLINKANSEYEKCEAGLGRESLEKAYALDPNNHIVLRGLGCLEQFEGKYESALEYFNRALELSTNKEIEYTLIGMVYYLQDKLDDAVYYFNLAIDMNDDFAEGKIYNIVVTVNPDLNSTP